MIVDKGFFFGGGGERGLEDLRGETRGTEGGGWTVLGDDGGLSATGDVLDAA